MNTKAKKIAALIGSAGALFATSIHQTMAYTFSASGVIIEPGDVTSVSGSAMNAVGTQYEVLKFLGLFLMISAASWVLTKILGIRIGGGTQG